MTDLFSPAATGIEQMAFSREKTLAMIEERAAEIVWLCDFAKGQVSDVDRYFLGFAKGYARQSAESAQSALAERPRQSEAGETPAETLHPVG